MKEDKTNKFVVWLPIIILILITSYIPEWILCQARRIIFNAPAFVVLEDVGFYNGKEGYPSELSDNFNENNRTTIIIKEKITKESYSYLFGNSYNSNDFKVYCNNQEAATETELFLRSCHPFEDLFLKYSFKSKIFLHHGINKVIIKVKDKEEMYFIEVLKEGEEEEESPEEEEDEIET